MRRRLAGILTLAAIWTVFSVPAAAADAPATMSTVAFPRFHPEAKRQQPYYPEALQKRGVCGIVGVEVYVDLDGAIRHSRVAMSSGHEELDALALKEVEAWKLTSGRVNGKPVAMWGTFAVTYSVEDEGIPMPDQERDLAELADKVDKSREALEAGVLPLPPQAQKP